MGVYPLWTSTGEVRRVSAGGGGGGKVRIWDGVQGLQAPQNHVIVFQILREGAISLWQQLASHSGKYTEGTEEVGTDISDFGVGGSGLQDTRDILQGSDPSSATVNIGDMGNEPTHKNNDGEISPPGGLFYHRKTTEGIGGEWGGHGRELEVPPSGWDDYGGRAGGGG